MLLAAMLHLFWEMPSHFVPFSYMQDELASKSNLVTKKYIEAIEKYYSPPGRMVAILGQTPPSGVLTSMS